VRLLPVAAVDLLPRRLWTPGNLFRLPGGDWHFCVKPGPRDRAVPRSSGEAGSSRQAVDHLTSRLTEAAAPSDLRCCQMLRCVVHRSFNLTKRNVLMAESGTLLSSGRTLLHRCASTLNDRRHQLQPLVLPQPSQT
jgi:hypothetical protein